MVSLPAPGLAALAGSGIPALTGWPDGPPLVPPGPFADRLDRLAADLAAESGRLGRSVALDWGRALTGRAALLGLYRRGTTSANGACRLLRTRDGWAAVNLPRRQDRVAAAALVAPAGIDRVDPEDPWEAVSRGVARLGGRSLVDQAALLGVAAAVLRRPPLPAGARGQPDTPLDAVHVSRLWPRGRRRSLSNVRVLDLSSMWAGPLATRILAAAGAAVVKVELRGRPDGTRAVPELYRWLHPGDQELVTIDVGTVPGRRKLRTLIAAADVVVESSRSRALAQLGAGPDDVAPKAGRIWVAITGYGRGGEAGLRVGFGDDAAVGGGLVAWDSEGHPVFCGDAIADPVTGMVAARAVMRAVAGGGGVLLDVALSSAAAWLAATPAWGRAPARPVAVRSPGGWSLRDGLHAVEVRDPVAAAPVPAADEPQPSRA